MKMLLIIVTGFMMLFAVVGGNNLAVKILPYTSFDSHNALGFGISVILIILMAPVFYGVEKRITKLEQKNAKE